MLALKAVEEHVGDEIHARPPLFEVVSDDRYTQRGHDRVFGADGGDEGNGTDGGDGDNGLNTKKRRPTETHEDDTWLSRTPLQTVASPAIGAASRGESGAGISSTMEIGASCSRSRRRSHHDSPADGRRRDRLQQLVRPGYSFVRLRWPSFLRVETVASAPFVSIDHSNSSKNARCARATTGQAYFSCARARPRAERSRRSAASASSRSRAADHTADVGLVDDEARVADDVRDLAAAAGEDRHAARHGLDQHPAELLAPPRRRLARRAQQIHRVQMLGHLVVRHASQDAHASGMGVGKRRQVVGHRSAADEQGAPRFANAAERLHQDVQAFRGHEPPEESHDRRIVAPSEPR